MTPEEALLTVAQVDQLHARALAAHGGQDGTRDPGLLESAVAAAANVLFYGDGDAFEIAAAYAFHIAENQPYLDGNKRTAIAAALVYLRLLGWTLRGHDLDLEASMLAIADRRLSRAGMAEKLRAWAKPLPP